MPPSDPSPFCETDLIKYKESTIDVRLDGVGTDMNCDFSACLLLLATTGRIHYNARSQLLAAPD